jgi:hypothetical protein
MAWVLSHTTFCTTRLYVVANDPSNDVVASRCGRNATPSGVVTVSGTSIDTHASAPAFSSPADPIASVSSRMSATCSSSQRS